LEPHSARTSQASEEESLAGEQRCLNAANLLNRKINTLLKADYAASIHMQLFARRELSFDDRSTRVHKDQSVPF
jgi:hypothetical protein